MRVFSPKIRLLDGLDLHQAINRLLRTLVNTFGGAAAGGGPALMSASGSKASF
jgi:hypothetical protein